MTSSVDPIGPLYITSRPLFFRSWLRFTAGVILDAAGKARGSSWRDPRVNIANDSPSLCWKSANKRHRNFSLIYYICGLRLLGKKRSSSIFLSGHVLCGRHQQAGRRDVDNMTRHWCVTRMRVHSWKDGAGRFYAQSKYASSTARTPSQPRTI
jgi:hypothetical protein